MSPPRIWQLLRQVDTSTFHHPGELSNIIYTMVRRSFCLDLISRAFLRYYWFSKLWRLLSATVHRCLDIGERFLIQIAGIDVLISNVSVSPCITHSKCKITNSILTQTTFKARSNITSNTKIWSSIRGIYIMTKID